MQRIFLSMTHGTPAFLSSFLCHSKFPVYISLSVLLRLFIHERYIRNITMPCSAESIKASNSRTSFTEQSLSSEASSRPADQEILRHLRNPFIHLSVHKCPLETCIYFITCWAFHGAQPCA
jgi:hypothetical protein